MEGFVKGVNRDVVAKAIFELQEGVIESILKVYFNPENYFSLDLDEGSESGGSEEGNEDDSEDSEKERVRREKREREAEMERIITFGEEAWDVFRCAVMNGNLTPFRRLGISEDWWISEASTKISLQFGRQFEYAAGNHFKIRYLGILLTVFCNPVSAVREDLLIFKRRLGDYIDTYQSPSLFQNLFRPSTNLVT
ncbi:hypothetical protein SUGI_0778780 [Cryptomeria japonica]|nr:hypothetical protein SUGI_0778780 [Cryptomeria japonica]